MNILVPDSWLREYLKTDATPQDIQKYLSLCGPSVERIIVSAGEPIYDVEITSNRPDAMSVFGIAREASVILPRFGIKAELMNNPYSKITSSQNTIKSDRKLSVKTDPKLNPRWTSVILTDVQVEESPDWLKDKLTKTGIRPINNIVDITNYLMRAFGQPAHAFDYDTIGKKNGVPTMTLRASKKGETLITLDGKKHSLPGDDIVIEDGSGKLIDLCGIMGGLNSSVKNTTKNIILFLQTYDPLHIRTSSMKLAHRTEAATLFEKGVDSELVMPAIIKGMEIAKEIAQARMPSHIYDIYPKPYKPYVVSTTRAKIDSYVGTTLTGEEISEILYPLGLKPKITPMTVSVTVPSYRADVTIEVDIIEEIARIYGYHNVNSGLPQGQIPAVIPDKILPWEEEIKMRLRDWGYTELLTYSMISEAQMDIFGLDKNTTYKITNPITSDWTYMRPKLWPSVLAAAKQNVNLKDQLQLFELSMVYEYRENDLPREQSGLLVLWTGHRFLEAKGLAETIFELFGIPFPQSKEQLSLKNHSWNNKVRLLLGDYGSVSEVNSEILVTLGINKPITLLSLYFDELVKNSAGAKKYMPLWIYPPIMEDLAFVVSEQFEVGPLIGAFKSVHKYIVSVSLLDVHENIRTLHVVYQDPERTLTDGDITPIRKQLLKLAREKFNISLKE